MENNGKNGNLQFFLLKKLNNLRKINSVEIIKGLSFRKVKIKGIKFDINNTSQNAVRRI